MWTKCINCVNRGNIRSAYHAAGIVCRSTGELTLSGCKNDGKITAAPQEITYYAGGMVAKSDGAVMLQNCQNSGEVTTSAKYVGGLCGYLGAEDVMKTILSCENSGIITCTGDNTQDISYMGGITGYMKGGKSYGTFSYCRNLGEIRSYAAGTTTLCGICGYVNSESMVIAYCSNSGSETSPNAAENTCYHVYYNPQAAEEKYIHDNDPWKYDNISFTICGKGTYHVPHEMTFGEWIMTGGSSTGNTVLWISPVTGFTQKQISENPAFSGVWRLYRDDVQGKLYAEIPSHRDASGNIILPEDELQNADNAALTIYDLITPNSEYRIVNHIN